MRIAQIAPIVESVPPVKYGGTERIISELTEELVRRGHEVTLFASGDSKTNAELFSVYHISLRKANIENLYGHNIWSLLNVGMAYQMQEKFDIIHDHNSQNNPVSLPLANLSTTPVVMTLHGPLTNGYSKAFQFYKKPYLVTISEKQKQPSPDLHYIGNVYHGLSMQHYPFSRDHDGYLLFVGRVDYTHGMEEKGLHHAIDVAEALGMPLIVAAKVNTYHTETVQYFKEFIQPRLKGNIRWIGEVDEARRNKLMSRAYCVLHPINYEEPFGLSMIEAMACGAPVVGFNRGSVSEVIRHGLSGFVVNNTAEMINAVRHIERIDREETRRYALGRFNVANMVDGYERIYNKILQIGKRRMIKTPDRLPKYSESPMKFRNRKKLHLHD